MTVTALDRALAVGDAGRVTGEQERPDPEVPEKARRRTFTAQYKLDVVAEYDAAATGEKGAVLRREGLYSSHVIEWRRARDAGTLAGPARPRGRPAADPRDAQIARLQKEKAKLEQELAKARFVGDGQAKLHAPWETTPETARTDPRVLREAGETRERRRQATHPAAVKPELVADGPNQVWSWDITKLHGPAKWTYYHLYVILDIYSRYAVGWMVATCESAALAEKLIAAACR